MKHQFSYLKCIIQLRRIKKDFAYNKNSVTFAAKLI